MDSELVTEMFALFIKPIYDILKEIPNCMAFVRVINHSKIGTYNWPWIKGAFFSESDILSSNLPIFQKNYSKKTILSLKFEIPAHISKQLIQISSSG